MTSRRRAPKCRPRFRRRIASSPLQKDVDLRCQSIADVRNELEKTYYTLRTASSASTAVSAIIPSPAARALPSIAVLPFLNLSSDKENEYFSDGLAEEIINSLTRVENLKVAARTSAFAFRGTQTDVQQIRPDPCAWPASSRRRSAQIRQS